MTADLATRGATALDAVREAMNENLGGQLRLDSLDRVKVPAGGGRMWSVPGLEGDEDVRELVGVIVGHKGTARNQHLKVYYTKAFSERSAEDGSADCYSLDGVTGEGSPGGECRTCPLNQYGSARVGKGKACSDYAELYFLREGDALPIRITVPTMSLMNVEKHMLRLSAKALPFWSVTTRLALEKTPNSAGIEYSRIVLAMGGRLEGDDLEMARNYAAMIRTQLDGRED